MNLSVIREEKQHHNIHGNAIYSQNWVFLHKISFSPNTTPKMVIDGSEENEMYI